MSAPRLALESLARRYDTGGGVDDISLEVAAGELLALVGASGSGKTTTLRLVAGYEKPDSGRLLLDGTSIERLPAEKRGFGMVFQHYALFPHLTVVQNVAFGLEARGMKKAERNRQAEQALNGVGLSDKASRPVQALSGGEQQRVALARALVIAPPVLLLDEPLSNLDPTLRRSTRDELRHMLRRQGVTALFVTHDQEDAFAVADRVAFLSDGKLRQVGTPESLYDLPSSRAVAEFIGHAALMPATFDGANASIRLGDTTLVVPAVAPNGLTSNALAVVRPEALRIDAERAQTNAWKGRVISRRFLGGTSAYHVALGDDFHLEVTSDDRSFNEGDSVRVSIARVPVALVAK
ncbi:MAG: ABC transporter ATP-binding protein [Gemmatimonadota bacterium]|nr:ABC transporter ATP-binding protein [Gemmatimonadota bacterium]